MLGIINNEEASEGWIEDEIRQEVLQELREKVGRCRWGKIAEEEFNDVLW